MGTMGAGGEGGGGGGERILVSVRMRPMNAKELERNERSDWECINNTSIIFNSTVPERCLFPTAYSFDRVFGFKCNTRQVYEEGAKEVALSVVCGINSSIFAYGQTSSGKTYTMTGITEYSMEDIYDCIQKHTQREFVLKFSAMEIYNEAVKDLLSPDNGPLRLLDDPEKGTIVEKLTEEILRDRSHLKELLAFCEAQRQIGETSLNETSSRSHQILRVTVESSAREFLSKDNFSTLSATVNFVDLAGSERASQALTAGNRLKEGCHINRSLLTLGTVIRKLSKGRNGHIPFRDSKLTRILQSTLGGNARTAIICTMSPARSHVEQSRNTLLFATCAKEVSTSAQVNVVMSDKALVKHLQRELAKLENELKCPGLVSQSDVLKEKESQIKRMEKEMKELMKQRDLAQSRLEDLLQVVGEDQTSREWEEFDQLSVPDEPIACEEDMYSISDTSGIAYQIPDFDFISFDMSNGRNAQHEQHLPRSVKQKEQYVASPTHSVISTRSLEMIPHQEHTKIGRTKSEDYDHCKEVRRKEQYIASPTYSIISTRSLEMIPHRTEIDRTKSEDYDHCKEVRCIEVDGSYTSRSDKFNLLTEESNNLFPPILDENEHDYGLKTKRTILPSKFDKNGNKDDELIIKGSPLSHASNDNYHGGYEPDTKEFLQLLNFDDRNHGNHEHKTKTYMEFDPEEKFQNAPKTTDNLVSTCAVDSSPWSALKELPSSRGLILSRSNSCRATLMTKLSYPWFQERDEHHNASPNNFLKDASQCPRDIQRRRIAALTYDAETNFPYKDSKQSTPGYVTKESIKTSREEGIRSLSNFVEGLKEMAQVQFQKQTMDEQEDEKISNRSTEVGRNVKDVGLDPMLITSESPSPWPTEFEKKQEEIIELWHVCHVSLVHRTYFFLLFKGDPVDSIYVEVEHRRLSFLKRSFSWGNLDKAVTGDGHATTLTSSVKNLRREREMLRKQMLKKLSAEERESLYKKWGVAVNSKQRRLQLAQLVWTGTNIEHIRESASLVANLIGLLEPERALKGMFGLNFTPQTTNSRSYSRKQRVSSFM